MGQVLGGNHLHTMVLDILHNPTYVSKPCTRIGYFRQEDDSLPS